jgi:hypothetical protein
MFVLWSIGFPPFAMSQNEEKKLKFGTTAKLVTTAIVRTLQ